MLNDLMKPGSNQPSNFQKCYLDHYESISILYADIIGFTKICSSIPSPNELVIMLNELFCRFDEAANVNKCFRAKILGDCYFCVSGIPENKDKPEPHAKQCVEMGLDMIEILAELTLDRPTLSIGNSNNEKRFEMRIGIHTGGAVCGIMGKKRWQFDVYSDSVRLASHMEKSSIPGRIHISEATFKQVEDDYEFEPAHGAERDAYIAEKNIKTYFVKIPNERRQGKMLANRCKSSDWA